MPWKSPLPIVDAELPYGHGYAWWCDKGTGQWVAQFERVHNADRDLTKWAAASARVATSLNPVQQVTIELQAAYVPAAAGSQKDYENKMLIWSACDKARQAPPPTVDPLPATWCGAQPQAPAAAAWRATGNTIFTTASGRISGVTSRKATPGAPCDGTVKAIVVGLTTYLPLQGGAANEATACTKP